MVRIFFNSAHQTLSIAILRGFAHSRHTDVGADTLQGLHIGGRSILHPLIRVVNLGLMLRPRHAATR